MGIPKWFDFAGCLEVTLILRDFKTVTGKLVGDFKDDHKEWDGSRPDYYQYDDHKCKPKDDDKCCKPKVDLKVDVEDKCEFILLELTRPAESVSLLEIESEDENEEEIEITVANVTFPSGSCIAVNVCDIIYAGVNADIDEEEIEIELEDAAVAANSTTAAPAK